MKKTLVASLLAATLAFPLSANAADYTIDTKGAHASVNFKISHLGYSYILGRFNKFEGTFSYDKDNLAASKVMVTVDTTSLDSNHSERDKHLKDKSFINASKYSTATFESTSITPKADGNFAINGNLTLKGVTKPMTIDAVMIGEGTDPWGGYRAGFEGTARIQLKDFGIKVVGSSSYVDLDLQVEGIRQ